MAEKLKFIEELSENKLENLSSKKNWFEYLLSSSNHYKYDFKDSYLIYKQRPDAKAVASFDIWTKTLNRRLDGAKGIALLREQGNFKNLTYVFDIDDTTGDKMPLIWQLKDEYKEQVSLKISDAIEKSVLSFDDTIGAYIDELVEDRIVDLHDELKQNFDNDLTDDDLLDILRRTLSESIEVSVFTRCGYDLDIKNFDFKHLQIFNSDESIVQLGSATSELSEIILRDIEVLVKGIERDERDNEHGNNIQKTGRSDDTRPKDEDGDGRTSNQVWNDEKGLSHEESQRTVPTHVTSGQAIPPLQTSGTRGQATDNPTNRADKEKDQSEGLGSDESRNREPSGKRIDLHEIEKKTGADDAPFFVEKIAPKQKRRTQAEMNYARFEKLVPHILDKRYSHAKLQSKGYMDLSIEWIGKNRIAIAHYGQQNGDMMADPDMELIVDIENKTLMPATYQNDYNGVFQKVYSDNNKWKPKLSKELTSFLNTWLRNIEFQGHVITQANYIDEEQYNEPIVFDNKGREYGYDIPHDLISSTKLREFQAERDGLNGVEPVIEVQVPTTVSAAIPQNVIETVIKYGGNKENSTSRIVAEYTKSNEDNTSFLSNEFLINSNGRGYIIDGKKYSAWFEDSGIRIAKGETALQAKKDYLVSYEQVDSHIKEMLQDGTFAPQETLDNALIVEQSELAERLAYLYGDTSDDYKIDSIQHFFKGSYPQKNETLAKVFNNPNDLQILINGVQTLIDDYLENRDVLRFHFHKPNEIMQGLKDIQSERQKFQSSIEPSPPQMFITQDEIDRLLSRGSNISESKFRIYSYFLNNTDAKDRIKFLKNEYGMGGSSYLGYSENHDGKGIKFTRSYERNDYETVNLTWNKVAKGIDTLINQNRFMTKEQLDYIPEYERHILARNIHTAYYRAESKLIPIDMNRYDESIKNIETILNRPISVDSLLDDLQKLVDVTDNEHRDYRSRNNALKSLTEYINGTYTLFNEVKEAMPLAEKFDENINEHQDNYIEISNEQAIKLLDDNHDVYLLYDESENLCDSGRRLIQHINNGGLAGIHSDFAYLLDESESIVDIPTKEISIDKEQYQPLFDAIIRQGNIKKTGLNDIATLIETTQKQAIFEEMLPDQFGEFGSEIKFQEQTIKWMVSKKGLEVLINGWDDPTLHYTWSEIASRTRTLYFTGDYLPKNESIPSSNISSGDIQDILITALKLPISADSKQNIINSFNNSNMEQFINDIKAEYINASMTFEHKEKRKKFHTNNTHFVITKDLSSPDVTTSIPYHKVADEISKMIEENTYVSRDELQSKLDIGMVVELDNRTYQVEGIDYMYDKIKLNDITLSKGTGFPILRSEKLSYFENQLEIAGFFVSKKQAEKETEEIEPSVPSYEIITDDDSDKHNFHITNNKLGWGGNSEKFTRNIAAIDTLKALEKEDRLATLEEQEIMSKYVGWGGLAKAFQGGVGWQEKYEVLKNSLDKDEYKAARASTLSSYYTSPTITNAIYKAIGNMGFRGGNILEPSMGVGNFFGMLPSSMNESKLYGVELDSITGRIAKQLYQKANIAIDGFENVGFEDNFFDVAVGNVPFGDIKVIDQRYDKHKFNIHDYFFAKTIDKVRPHGIIAFVTSKGTLDKANSSVRKYICQRAELIGAIRLPNTAFKANAGTGVTSDIVFLKKRENIIDLEEDWVQLGEKDGMKINQYFVDNSQMVLGDLVEKVGMYGAKDVTCEPYKDEDLSDLLDDAITHINAEYDQSEYMLDEPDDKAAYLPADPNVKNYSYAIVDNTLYYRENSKMFPANKNNMADKRVRAMIGLRKQLNTLMSMMYDGYDEFSIKKHQRFLDNTYDDFVRKYGRINSRANSVAMSDDGSYFLLCSLEVLDEKGEFKQKADIFTKQTIKPFKEITHVDTSVESIAVSLNQKGKIDVPYMAKLTDKDVDTIISELKGLIFKSPRSDLEDKTIGWQTADEYLSGDVKEKLSFAEAIAEKNPEYSHHVTALEKVQPKDIEAIEISVRLGATWIPQKYINQFIFETLNTPRHLQNTVKAQYSDYNGTWNISKKFANRNNINVHKKYGTNRKNAYEIIEDTLNLKSVRVTDKTTDDYGNEKYVLNKKETMLASQKQTLIKERFKDWIFKDETRRNELVQLYNDTFNNIRPREYDGSHITFEGMNPEIQLRPHQKNAVSRDLYGGNTLLAHEVGAGKTFTMIAAAMEGKRLGLCNKSMITVPNHLTEQWASEALRLYPAAKVLVTTKKDFQPKNRKKFCSKIATGDYDIVITGHSQFEKIPLSKERTIRMTQQQIDEISFAIADQRGQTGMNYNVKQMEKTRQALEVRLKKLNEQNGKDDVIEFEKLGIDKLFVDESQSFKNLYVITQMRNVAGVSTTNAKKSADMFMKCQYLDELTGGKGITFASGTPISNSMTELFTLQRYLQMFELKKRGLQHFDAWASVFGDTVTAYELATEGTGFRMRTRFSKFNNLPELLNMFKEVADIQTGDMLDLPTPKLKDNKVINISVDASDIQKDMIAELGERAEDVRNSVVEPHEDNMLKITNDGRKVALDQRLINPCYKDDPNSKINTAMENVYKIWEDNNAERLTQLVFCDLSTPKKDGSFNVYDDLKKKWIEKGVPEHEIAFIHDAKTDAGKANLFAKVRSGDVRILLGSTSMCGAGTNVQTKLKAVHHLDCPWKPSDITQRNGRILRQGNNNEEVEIYRYITKETFDAYSYQIVEQKQKFISQIMTSKSPARSADDIDDASLSYAEVKALASGNPLIKEKMELENEVAVLKLMKSDFNSQKYRYEGDVSTRLPNQIKGIEQFIDGITKDINDIKSKSCLPFEITLNGKTYIDKKDAGILLLGLAQQAEKDNSTVIGSYKGFEMSVYRDSLFNSRIKVFLKGNRTYSIELGDNGLGNLTRIDNSLKTLDDMLTKKTSELESTKSQLDVAKAEVNKEFPKAIELREKLLRLDNINTDLSMDKDDPEQIGSDEPQSIAPQKDMERAI